MKKLLLSAFIATSIMAAMFQSVSEENATLINKGKDGKYCKECGMNLPMFYKTNHIHANNQYCSLRCFLVSGGEKNLKDAKVVDNSTLKFIPVKEAFYVVGSNKPGTMSKNSKYAFALKQSAEKFAKDNGGTVMGFKEALKIAKEDLQNDSAKMKMKLEKTVYKKGKMLYESKCQKVDIKKYQNIAAMKADLKCEDVDEKALQLIARYAWDKTDLDTSSDKITPPKDAKCPICGMFVAKYPKWVSLVKSAKEDLYFDGVKDMMKYVLKNKNEKYNIFVSDYFTTKKIDAKKAYFVLGSNVFGPMGKELIPFESEEAANAFSKDHFGKKILSFEQINEKIINQL